MPIEFGLSDDWIKSFPLQREGWNWAFFFFFSCSLSGEPGMGGRTYGIYWSMPLTSFFVKWLDYAFPIRDPKQTKQKPIVWRIPSEKLVIGFANQPLLSPEKIWMLGFSSWFYDAMLGIWILVSVSWIFLIALVNLVWHSSKVQELFSVWISHKKTIDFC